jgi:hypothetical protein
MNRARASRDAPAVPARTPAALPSRAKLRPAVLALLALLTACLAALAAPAPAPAAPVIGVSEGNAPVFGDRYFRALGIPTSRLLLSYDVVLAARHGNRELAERAEPYIAASQWYGVEPLVTFQHQHGDDCWRIRGQKRKPCHVPSVARYRKALRAFLVHFPSVRVISPWNEANHPSQPTASRPALAARYTNTAASVCKQVHRRCTIVVADVLDAVDNERASRRTYTKTQAWVRRFRASLRVPRRVCGLHNYSDVNRFRDSGTRALMRALGCREYWLTEVGGIYRYRTFWNRATKKAGRCKTAAKCQVKATKYLLGLLGRFKRIRRFYVHSWYTQPKQGFDAGLMSGKWPRTRPRPAFQTLQRWVRAHRSSTRLGRA